MDCIVGDFAEACYVSDLCSSRPYVSHDVSSGSVCKPMPPVLADYVPHPKAGRGCQESCARSRPGTRKNYSRLLPCGEWDVKDGERRLPMQKRALLAASGQNQIAGRNTIRSSSTPSLPRLMSKDHVGLDAMVLPPPVHAEACSLCNKQLCAASVAYVKPATIVDWFCTSQGLCQTCFFGSQLAQAEFRPPRVSSRERLTPNSVFAM